jgi:phosphopantetheine--protein transferase-like protein
MPVEGDIFGIGIDVVSWKRIERFLSDYLPESLERILTAAEREAFRQSAHPVESFARFFTAKEAAFKAQSGAPTAEVGFQQIEIVLEGPNRFRVNPERASAPGELKTTGEFFETPEGIGALAVTRRHRAE